MGFSLVAAAAIIGVSVLIAIEVIVGTTVPTLTNVHESFKDMKDRAINQVQTDINITSVTTEVNGSNTDINITIENIGSISLETSYFYILINGTSNVFTCSNLFLHPEDEVYFNVSSLSSTGPRRLKVVTNLGISDYYDFTI
jgi:archaellum component FlaF (FlaF/FlaG flagellin family)